MLELEKLSNKILLYKTENGKVNVDVMFEGDTFWLNQKSMGELFCVESHTITYHLQEIFKSKELDEEAVTRNFGVTASDDKKYNTKFYNLKTIIAVGYCVNIVEKLIEREKIKITKL